MPSSKQGTQHLGLAHDPAPSHWSDGLTDTATCTPTTDAHSGDAPSAPSPLPERCDVCIVGCGITGAALAYYLSRHHHTDADGDDGSSTEGSPQSIVVLDARTVAGGATGRNGGIMWPDTSDPFEVGGAELMREFVATHHVDCGWVASGGVSLVGDPLHPEQARAAVEGDDADLLDSVTAIDPLATLGAAPGAFTAGYKDASVVTLRAARVALALARLAADNGVTLRENCPVTDIVGGGAGEVAVVSTTIGSLQCGRVIVATNGWLPRLLPELGPHIRACTNTVMSSAKPVPPHLRWNLAAVSCGEGAKEVYCVMTEAGTLVMGGLRDSGDMWSGDDDQAPGDSRIVPLLENWFNAAFPELAANVEFDKRWLGVLGYPVDGMPVVGQMPGRPNVEVCGGYCGHGMPRALRLARAVAGRIVGNGVDSDALERWDVKRFF